MYFKEFKVTPFVVVVVDSGAERTLSTSEYKLSSWAVVYLAGVDGVFRKPHTVDIDDSECKDKIKPTICEVP